MTTFTVSISPVGCLRLDVISKTKMISVEDLIANAAEEEASVYFATHEGDPARGIKCSLPACGKQFLWIDGCTLPNDDEAGTFCSVDCAKIALAFHGLKSVVTSCGITLDPTVAEDVVDAPE